MFFRGSRYETVPNAELTTGTGRVVRYKRMRFIPDTRDSVGYVVVDRDRLDLIAYRFYRDPEQFWRICDANLALRPDELLERPGRVLAVPIPQG
jgi:hypothetical protein